MNCEQKMPEKENTSNLFEELEDIRVFKGPEPNFYILAIKLTSKEKAAHFVSKFNGSRFNQLEPDECQLYSLDSAHLTEDAFSSPSL